MEEGVNVALVNEVDIVSNTYSLGPLQEAASVAIVILDCLWLEGGFQLILETF